MSKTSIFVDLPSFTLENVNLRILFDIKVLISSDVEVFLMRKIIFFFVLYIDFWLIKTIGNKEKYKFLPVFEKVSKATAITCINQLNM